MAKLRVGEILVSLGYLNAAQLEGTLVHQRQWGISLGRSAIVCGFCTEQQVFAALAKQAGLPTIDLDQVELGSAFSPLIPERVAAQHFVVPLRTSGSRAEVLVVAMAPPASLSSQDAVRAISRKARLEIHLASDEAIQRAIARLYHGVTTGHSAPQVERGTLNELVSADTELSEFLNDGQAPEPTLMDRMGLTPHARKVVEAFALSRSMSTDDVLRRLVEVWAAARGPTGELLGGK